MLYRAYVAWAARDGRKPVKAGEFYERLATIPAVRAYRLPEDGTRGFLGLKITDHAGPQP